MLFHAGGVEEDGERGIEIGDWLAASEAERGRGRLTMRRAIALHTAAADAMYRMAKGVSA